MSWLPAGQTLRQSVPDFEELLRDPVPYLADGPVILGPRRMYGLGVLFLLMGAALLASLAYTGKTESSGERIALGIGLSLGGLVWLGWSLALAGHQMILRTDGVEVKYQGSAVWCPWALFNADGEPYVPQTDSPLVGLTMPINPEAVPFIEEKRHDSPVAHGVQVKTRQLTLAKNDEVVLPARYQVNAVELGFLLQHLGRRLGRQLPRGVPPPEAHGQIQDEPLELDSQGRFRCRLSRLQFPALCCKCEEPTTETMPFLAESRAEFLLNLASQRGRAALVPIPLCPRCQEELEQGRQRNALRFIVLSAVLTLGTFFLITMSQNQALGAQQWVFLSLFMALLGGTAGLMLSMRSRKNVPVRLRMTSPAQGIVEVWFRNTDYSQKTLDKIVAVEREKR